MTISRLFLAALFAIAILFWHTALAVENASKRQAGLGMFLILPSMLIFHDSYGNRLLPPPNQIAQVMGYIKRSLCLTLGIRMLAAYLRKSK